jgi:hypothetical protein
MNTLAALLAALDGAVTLLAWIALAAFLLVLFGPF